MNVAGLARRAAGIGVTAAGLRALTAQFVATSAEIAAPLLTLRAPGLSPAFRRRFGDGSRCRKKRDKHQQVKDHADHCALREAGWRIVLAFGGRLGGRTPPVKGAGGSMPSVGPSVH